MDRLSIINKSIFLPLFLLIVLSAFSLVARDTDEQTSSLEKRFFFYFSQAELLRSKGESRQAIAFFEKAAGLADKINDLKGKLNSLIHLGTLYWNIGELIISHDKYAEALEIARKLKDENNINFCSTALSIYAIYKEAKEYRKFRNISLSIDKFNEAIRLAKKINSNEHELKCLRQLSLTYWEDNRFQDFLDLSQEALKIALKINHRQEEGRCLNNIGLFYWKTDNYSEALRYFEKALKIARETDNKEEESNCLTNIAAIYIQLGNYENALNNLILASEMTRKLGDNSSLSLDITNIGNVYRRRAIATENKQDLLRALNYYKEALDIARRFDDASTIIDVLNNIGTVYSNLNDFSNSMKFFKEALIKADQIRDREKMSFILTNMGIVYAQLGNYEESTRYYQRAIDLALEIRGGKILWEAYFELANSYKNQGNLNGALDNYRKSISVIENIRSAIDIEELRATFLGSERKIEAYYNIIDLLVKLNQKDSKYPYKSEAFHYLERAKARAFLDSMEVSKIDLSAGISQKLLNQEAELMNEISKIHSKLLNYQLTPEQRQKANEELEALEDQLESLKREIRAASPAYANLRYPRPIKLEEAQRSLIDKDTAVFAYALGRESSYVLVLSTEDIAIFPLPNYKEIDSMVRSYVSSITNPESQDFSLGYTLYKILVEPGLKVVNPKKIIFIPDDILYFLPFEALLTKKEKREWLIKECDIAYVPSLSVLRELTERRKSNNKKPSHDILAVGDPFYGKTESYFYPNSDYQFFRLRYSGQEVIRIASFFKPQKRDVLLREGASEENFKEKDLSDYRIIHLAAHALINDRKASRSAIILSLDDDPKEDGFLQMREIFNLKLNADLVALSACQTGLGQLIRGEGIEGLSRAFFYAGASALLISLWAINDEASSQLLERFYYYLCSSLPINTALRKAKLELIESGILSHPYFWGSFIVSGEADRIVLPRKLNRWIILTLSLCAGLAILVIWISREKWHQLNIRP